MAARSARKEDHMVRRSIVAALAALALFASACQEKLPSEPVPGANPPDSYTVSGYPLTLTDDEGAEITLDTPPDRVVTFAPSHTEILFELGLGDRLVGVSGPFDDYPAEAASVEAVAGRSGVEPNIEKVVSLEPDVVLTAFIGGEWKERLRELEIPVFTTLAASFEDALFDMEVIGNLLGVAEEAHALTTDLRATASAVRDRVEESEPVTCFLDLSDLFTVGPGSLEFDLMERAGCDPVTSTSDDPYPQWSLEQLVQDDPDVYLVAEGVPVDRVSSQEGIRDLTAVREGRIHEVNADLISRPGPRVAQGIEELAALLHDQPTV
jgi:cobalamin transport system substrate-binding protein